MKELWVRLKELEGSRSSEENLQSQLTWVYGGSQRLNHQQKSMHWLDLGCLYLCNKYLSLMCVSWRLIEARTVSDYDSVASFCTPFLQLGYPVCPQWQTMNLAYETWQKRSDMNNWVRRWLRGRNNEWDIKWIWKRKRTEKRKEETAGLERWLSH